MDRALKERTIGAVVLVAFAVLIVPVFLDGPSSDTEIVSEPVSLPGQNDQTRKSQTIVLERDRTKPVPPAGNEAADKVAADKVAADKAAAKKVAEEEKPDPPAKTVVARKTEKPPAKSPPKKADKTARTVSPTGMWAVQLGSFSNQENADRLAADLRDAGYAAFLSQLRTESGPLHRVRVGPQKNRDNAEAIAAKLKSAGHTGQVVPHP